MKVRRLIYIKHPRLLSFLPRQLVPIALQIMPTTRRKTHGPASRGAQSTLSFGSRAKVTKPSSSTTHASKAKSLESSVHAEVEPEDVQASSTLPEAPTVAELGPTKVEVVAAEQAKAEIETKPIRTKEVEEAESIGYKRLRSYWRGREDERKAPRGKAFCLL